MANDTGSPLTTSWMTWAIPGRFQVERWVLGQTDAQLLLELAREE